MQNIEQTTTRVADTATGVVVEATEAVTDPRRRLRRLERAGAPLNRQLTRTARQVLGGTIPERVAKNGLRMVKARAKRRDRVGEATYRALELISGGLDAAASALRQLGEATEPPARGPRSHAATSSSASATSGARARPVRRRPAGPAPARKAG
jgi:hypothetical protein